MFLLPFTGRLWVWPSACSATLRMCSQAHGAIIQSSGRSAMHTAMQSTNVSHHVITSGASQSSGVHHPQHGNVMVTIMSVVKLQPYILKVGLAQM